jgi:hypothetical protein
MTKNEILTENDVQCKQAKHAIRKALQMPKLATHQDEIEMHDELSTRSSKPAAPPYIPRKSPSSKSGPGHPLPHFWPSIDDTLTRTCSELAFEKLAH